LFRRAVESTAPSHKGHRQLCEQLAVAAGINLRQCDTIPETRLWNRQFKLTISSFAKGNPSHDRNWGAYTDGSLFQGRADSGWCIYYDGKFHHSMKFQLGSEATVFQMEIYAIKKLAEWFQGINQRNQTITVHWDSQAALPALSGVEVKSKLVLDTIHILNEICLSNFVYLRWVKAHV